MPEWPLLSLVIFLPLIGAGFILMIRGEPDIVARNAKSVALWTSGIAFLLSLLVWANFDADAPGFQMTERAEWLGGLGISYYVGVDGISLFFVVLSTLLTVVCVLASWHSVDYRVRDYMVAFLVMDTMMVGAFCALDLILFYLFFEGTLIPMFLIIGIWGGARRIYSAFKFFLYSFAGTVLFFVAILVMYFQAGTTDIPRLLTYRFDPGLQTWLWLGMFASFAVKLPMWPFHTWLPDAHVEAPTAGSVLLAGILLKLGGYGFVRFSVGMMPEATEFFTPLIYALSIVAIVYTSLVALMQDDMKKLIAYSSVAHMGIVTIGLFTLNPQGIQGGVIQMLSHGAVSGALFLCVGVVYDRTHSREIAHYGGLAERMPLYAAVFMLFTLASVGLPGTSGFVGEILVIVGVFQVNAWVAALAALGMILSAAYMLWLYRRVIFGALTKDHLRGLADLRPNEIAAFAPLVLLVLLMGIYPVLFLDPLAPAVERLLLTAGLVDGGAATALVSP